MEYQEFFSLFMFCSMCACLFVCVYKGLIPYFWRSEDFFFHYVRSEDQTRATNLRQVLLPIDLSFQS